MVDVHLSSLIPPLPPSPSPPQFAHNEMQSPGCEPLPYSKGCGLNQHHLSSLRSEDIVTAPLLFQRDVGSLLSLDGRIGKEDMQEGTQEVKGPTGTSQQRTMTFVIVHFHHSFAALAICIPNASTTVQWWRVVLTQWWRTSPAMTQKPDPPTRPTPHKDTTDSNHDNNAFTQWQQAEPSNSEWRETTVSEEPGQRWRTHWWRIESNEEQRSGGGKKIKGVL